MIRYKVVHANRCSLFAGGKYREHYLSGDRMQAQEGTLGFFVFTKRWLAEAWIALLVDPLNADRRFRTSRSLHIVRVDCKGRGHVPKFIASTVGQVHLDWFYKRTCLKSQQMTPPVGTICYKELEVLN